MRKLAFEMQDKAQKTAIEEAKTLLKEVNEQILDRANCGCYSAVFTIGFENKINLDQNIYSGIVRNFIVNTLCSNGFSCEDCIVNGKAGKTLLRLNVSW